MKIKRPAVVLLCLLLLILTSCSEAKKKTPDDVQMQTDTEPIYNHFPTFPYTEKMEWYSETSGGIGLTTTNLYVFAYYDDTEISNFLEGTTLSEEAEDMDTAVIPESVRQDDSWRKVMNLPCAFQDGIPETKLMNTDVYINSDCTIIYMHVMGE